MPATTAVDKPRLKVQLFKPKVRQEAAAEVEKVLKSGWLGCGPKTREFEDAFAGYVGAKHCAAVNSCTSGLHLAFKLLDLKPGDEVITTAVTFISTNYVLLYEGLKPVFADIDPSTGCLDPISAAEHITQRTRAVMLMHYGGYPCDLDAFYSLGARYGLHIIEDCAHAAGSRYKERPIGSHDSIQVFSFDPIKNLTTGEGGALTTASDDYDHRLRRLRYLGIDKDSFTRHGQSNVNNRGWDYNVVELGYRYHMSDIMAAIGLVQLKYLEDDNRRRREIAAFYSSELADVPGITLLKRHPNYESSRFMFAFLAENRDGLAEKLTENGVGICIHFQRNDRYPMYRPADLPKTEYFCDHTLTLPMSVDLTEEELSYVVGVIKEGW